MLNTKEDISKNVSNQQLRGPVYGRKKNTMEVSNCLVTNILQNIFFCVRLLAYKAYVIVLVWIL